MLYYKINQVTHKKFQTIFNLLLRLYKNRQLSRGLSSSCHNFTLSYQPIAQSEDNMAAHYFIYLVIGIAFLFDFVNGFHDAPNSISTIVATGALKPIWAVVWAAFFNFIAFLFFHLKVASTLGAGLANPDVITPFVILAALSSAIIFNLFTWYIGLPSSSSHALIGGLVGAVIIAAGINNLKLLGLTKVLLAIVISPLLGLLLSALLLWLVHLFFSKNTKRTSHWFKRFQLISAALLSLGHGGNDAQKTMGIIAVTLFSANLLGPTFYVPIWVVISCNLVMGLGTLMGGWRIVKTLGERITQLNSINGSIAEASSAAVLFAATYLGIPVSTTHIVTGAITGAGTKNGLRSVNWKILQKIVLTWFITIPCTGLIAATIIAIQRLI